mmetsp:Transcript_39620/g.93227  ORF Transcript_39620/g.93227 Transcript_39620/m.93227 type:complete len:2695 (+) Transcript_39620:129-8213(+)
MNSGGDGDERGGDSPFSTPNDGDPSLTMTKEHAAAFKKVMEKRRIIWCDYAAAFQAALECVNTQQSQDFATKYIPKALPMFCGEGDPPSLPYGHTQPPAGSAWDDWCGTQRRKGSHPAEDQTKYFQTALRCAVKLVLASLDRGSADLIDALDVALDPNSAIYAFHREANRDAHEQALALLEECQTLWREGGGPQKRLELLDRAPWKSLLSVVKSVDNSNDGTDKTNILNVIAERFENAPVAEISEAGKACTELITHFKKENYPAQSSSMLGGLFKSDPRKTFKRRLKVALRNLALRGTKSGVWAHRRASLELLEYSIKRDKEFKESSGAAMCAWLEEHSVITDLFGERAHATIVSETVSLLTLVELNEARLNVIVDAAFMHVGSVRAEVHKVILALLRDLGKRQIHFILDRIMDVFDVPAAMRDREGAASGGGDAPAALGASGGGAGSALGSLTRGGSDCLQAAFELVCAIFDTSKLPGLYTTVDVMMKGKKVATRAMDVLVAALLTPFCEDQDVFAKLVQDSLFHCLQSSWGEVDGNGTPGQGKFCKEYVAELCCNIVKDPKTSRMAVRGAFAVLMEVIRLFPRSNFALRGDKTREACIYGLQQQFDVLQACMASLKVLSQDLNTTVMDSDEVLNTELWTRLLQLRYLLENCGEKEYSLMLDERQIDYLWEALGGSTEACLRWLRLAADSGGIFDEKVQRYLFEQHLCTMDPARLRPHGFNCFQAFFGDVNSHSEAMVVSGRDGIKSGCKINGAAFVGRRVRVLWKDEKMHNGTICALLPEKWHTMPSQRHTVRWDDTGKEDTHDWTDLHDWHLLEDELSVNILAYEIRTLARPGQLQGMEFLWNACQLSKDDTVAGKAADMLLDLSRHMPTTFQDEILQRLLGSHKEPGVLSRVRREQDATLLAEEGLQLKRCLQVLKNLVQGQLRICDTNVFAYKQLQEARAHGFRGRGKALSVSVHLKDEHYKAVIRTVECHSRQALDDVIAAALPHMNDVDKHTVVYRKQRLVRGPHTTLEELNIVHGAELKVEYDKLTQGNSQPAGAVRSISDVMAKNHAYFQVLFELMDDRLGLEELVWGILMALPTLEDQDKVVASHSGPWEEVLLQGTSLWRAIYVLQIVAARLEPEGVDAATELAAQQWRLKFLERRGVKATFQLMGSVMQAAQAAPSLVAKAFPTLVRVLRLCTGAELVGSQGKGGAPPTQQSAAKRPAGLDVLQVSDAWEALWQATDVTILLSSAAPSPHITDALVDAATVLSFFLREIASGSRLSEGALAKLFAPRSRAELVALGLKGSEIQEGSRMWSNTGILVHRLLLYYSEQEVRNAVSVVVLEIGQLPEAASQIVDLMCECISTAHRQCSTCGNFFQVLTQLLMNSEAVKRQPAYLEKAAHLSTTLLLSAEEVADAPLPNEMIAQLLQVLNHVMTHRPPGLAQSKLQGFAKLLIPKLWNEFLMRVPTRTGAQARRMMNKASLGGNFNMQAAPLCEVPETREEAWRLVLTAVMHYSPESIKELTQSMLDFALKTRVPVKVWWNRMNATPKEDWEHKATVERRKLACVGLKNQGATCYMNAMLQQLFLEDTLRACLLTAPLAPAPPQKEEECWRCAICTLENDWSSRVCCACEQGERPEKVDPVAHGEVLKQLQRTFRFMVDSELQSFDPIQLVEGCRDLGLHFRVTSQNDSSEFFDKLLERLEKEVGGKQHPETLKHCFRVRVSSQLVSVECPHRKPINAGVFEKSFKVNVERMGTLERAIEDALAGELMTGDSRVDCEKCTLQTRAEGRPDAITRRAMKRTLFLDGENMPGTLCIQLNRFQFQGNSFVKLNDRLAFPLTLDLAPYTKPPKSAVEDMEDETFASEHDTSVAGSDAMAVDKEGEESLVYDLKGIVVHSGQFSFGHYYSFAKDPISGKWLKLDDDQVSEFDLADMEGECFGGVQTTVNKWTNCVYKTEKSASAYMLFYSRKGDTPPVDPPTPMMTPKSARADSVNAATPDSVSDTAMGHLHLDGGPVPATPPAGSADMAAGVDEILDTNEQMLRRSLFYEDGFSCFVLDFVAELERAHKGVPDDVLVMALVTFYKSVLHAESRPRLTQATAKGRADWASTLKRLVSASTHASATFLRMALTPDDGPDNLPSWFEGGVVTCPVDEARACFTELMVAAVRRLAVDPGPEEMGALKALVEAIEHAVPAVSHNWRNMQHFGALLEAMASSHPRVVQMMRDEDLLGLLLHLYLGPKSPGIKEFPKLAAMGTTSPWPANGRSEADSSGLLRAMSLMMQGNEALPSKSTMMMAHSLRQTLVPKLCDTDPMGGIGPCSEPLLVELCRRSDLKLLLDVGSVSLAQLQKQFAEPLLRVRQSRCAILLCRVLESIEDEAAGWVASEAEVREVRETLVRELLKLLRSVLFEFSESYHHTRNTSARPLAQALVLMGQIPGVVLVLERFRGDLEYLAKVMNENFRARQQPGGMPALVPVEGASVAVLLGQMSDALTMAKQALLPTELYVMAESSETAHLVGVYRQEGPLGMNQGGAQGEELQFCRVVDATTGYTLSKVMAQFGPDGHPLPADAKGIPATVVETWELAEVSGNVKRPLWRTPVTPASAHRFPPPCVAWAPVEAPPSEPVVLRVIAQWDPDAARGRGGDFGSGVPPALVDCGLDQGSKIDVGTPMGSRQQVRFDRTEDQNSDSASDEAIAGSDQEGGDDSSVLGVS